MRDVCACVRACVRVCIREGIQPMWEDSNNARGGKWQYSEKRFQVINQIYILK